VSEAIGYWASEDDVVEMAITSYHSQHYALCRCGLEFFSAGDPSQVSADYREWQKHECKVVEK
jgi:hypothetical protein